jgi:beta propeller repeat protein
MKIIIIFTTFAAIFLMTSISAVACEQNYDISWGHNPAIYGNNVVWANDTFGNNGIIHLYNLTTAKDTIISSFNASHPAIYGNKMV